MQHTPYTLPVAATGVVTAATAIVALRGEKTTAARAFVVVACAISITSFGYVGELTASSLAAKLLWLDVRWIGICAAPTAALLLALAWSEREAWLTRTRIAALAAIPVATLLLAWTNELHHATGGPSRLLSRGSYTMRTADSGWAFWIFLLHAYASVIAILWIYARAAWSSRLHRRQGIVLFVATLCPWLSNAVFVFGLAPDPAFDSSSFGYAAACVLWVYALRRERLLDLVPIARDRVFESLGDAVLVVDAAGRAVDLNPAARRLFESGEASVGRPLGAILGDEVAAKILSCEPPFDDLRFGERWFEIDASTIESRGGITARVVTLRDTTAKRALETARRAFIARMSHEVRSPLHGIAGASELLLDAPLRPDDRKLVDAIATSARALRSVVDEVLDFAKLDEDRMRVEVRAIAIGPLVESVGRLFDGEARRRGIELSCAIEGAPYASADSGRLRQVLNNLVSNALKYTDAGFVRLSVTRSAEEVRIEVADSGIGVPAEAHARIFEAFEQVDDIPREGVSGTGLGLPIAKRLVELMDGTLAMESAPGKGSTFTVRLRAAQPLEAEAASIESAAPPAARREGRVLLVDDHPVSRLVAQGILEREGCEVDVVEGGEAALEQLRAQRYALVLTDVRMRGLDGYALATEIAAESDAPPVVALTADVGPGERERGLSAGMTAWLSKPLDLAELRAVLDRHLPRRQARVSPQAAKARALHAFHASAPIELRTIREALTGVRWQEARDAAHALGGAAALLGHPDFLRVCDAIPREPEGGEAWLVELETMYQNIAREHAA